MQVAMPLAVVGSGAIADYYYFPLLASDPHLSVNTWIVEPAVERGVKAAEKFGFRKDQVVGSIEDLPPSIRLAVNATPSHLHRATTIALIERDISVLVEKPFAETAADARAMIAAAEGRAILTANHFRRLTPSYAFVRDAIASGRLGEIKRISWAEGHKFDWPTQSGFNFRRPWEGRPRGALLDIGVHIFDIVCWWLDDQPRVTSAVMDGYGGPEAFVSTQLATDNARIDVQISFLNKLSNTFSVEGTRGAIRGVTNEFTRLELVAPDGTKKTVSAPGNPDRADIARRMVTNFMQVVAGASVPLLIDARSVVPPLDVIDEIYAKATDYLPDCYQEWVA